MKFSIYGFNQEKLVQEYNTLNGNDLIVLRVLVDMLPRMTRRIEINGRVFKQVTYDMLLKDVPFVTQSESTLKKIVKKLIDSGLIEREVVSGNGKYTYFRATDALKEIEYIPETVVEEKTTCECDLESESELEDRIEYIEQVLTTRASKEIIEELKRFRSQREFFIYFDEYIWPDKSKGKRNTCKYMLKSLRLYFSGELQ